MRTSRKSATVPGRRRSTASSENEYILHVEGLQGGYGKKEILHGVTVSLSPGELVALIGPNGAGKSTLLKLVAGLILPTAGQVRFKGLDITNSPTYRRARRGIGYLIQGNAIFSNLTIDDHLKLAHALAKSENRGRPRESDISILPHLDARRDDPAGLFSGGERQALALAAILATQPECLLADEPSAGLAPAAAKRLLESLAKVSREKQLPVLWVEQRVNQVLSLVDRAILMRGGRIVAETSTPKKWLGGDVLTALTFGEEA